MKRSSVSSLGDIRWTFVIALVATACLVSCSKQGTQLVVLVDSDYAVPTEFATVRVDITNPPGVGITTQTYAIAPMGMDGGLTRFGLPLSFGVTPPSGVSNAPVTVVFSVLNAAGETQSTRTVVTGFLDGEALLLPVFLPRACHDVPCAMPSTCGDNATCVSAIIDPHTLAQATNPTQLTTFDVPLIQDVSRPDVVDAQIDAALDVAAVDATDATDAVDATDATDAAVDVGPCDANPLNDPLNCGMCGVVCAGGTPVCVGGTCAANNSSCEALTASGTITTDGDYMVYANGDAAMPWTAHCVNVATNPRTYLPLVNTAGTFNFAQYTVGGASNGTTVTTHYTYVRILPTSLTVDGTDQAFTTSAGRLTHSSSGTLVTSVGYGAAIDCLGSGSLMGVANVDLRGTHFSVVPGAFSYPPHSVSSAGTATYSMANQVVDVTGGGFCGWESPGGYFDINMSGPDLLPLAYVP